MDMHQKEVDQNFETFLKQLPEILEARRGKFALMRHGEIVDYFDSAIDAHTAGQKLFDDDIFSIQQVNEVPADLGYFSYALPQRSL